mmetsp:Transcript_116254/g.333860  ORF Transcript_116254/g.333860 Transcript_116254/m.333860 type:complete len:235 (+) Transcript_116254:657-1361(+)
MPTMLLQDGERGDVLRRRDGCDHAADIARKGQSHQQCPRVAAVCWHVPQQRLQHLDDQQRSSHVGQERRQEQAEEHHGQHEGERPVAQSPLQQRSCPALELAPGEDGADDESAEHQIQGIREYAAEDQVPLRQLVAWQQVEQHRQGWHHQRSAFEGRRLRDPHGHGENDEAHAALRPGLAGEPTGGGGDHSEGDQGASHGSPPLDALLARFGAMTGVEGLAAELLDALRRQALL